MNRDFQLNSTARISIIKRIEIPEALIQQRSDGIIHVHYKKNTTLDVELQVNMRALFFELTEGKKAPFIFSADEGFSLTKEARENAGISAKESPISAYAIIAESLGYRIIANFYLKVNKPKLPYKLFPSIDDAVKWLYLL